MDITPKIAFQPEKNVVDIKSSKKENLVKSSNSKKVLTSHELMQLHFDVLNFDQGWENFMQEPAKNMRVGISGKPKNGKTAGACQFAAYLTKFGNVLYNFADQGFSKSTKDLWKLAGLENNARAMAADFLSLDDLEKEIASGSYQFIFIDLINSYIDRFKIKPHEFEDRFLKKYPNVSFVLIFEVTKSGIFKGDQKWMHIVDTIVEVKNFLMENAGRYGNGNHVVWEKGLKKLNPKLYNELYPQHSQNTSQIVYV